MLEDAAGGTKGSLMTVRSVPDVQLFGFFMCRAMGKKTKYRIFVLLTNLLIIRIQNLGFFDGC